MQQDSSKQRFSAFWIVGVLVAAFLSFSPYRKVMPGPSPGELLVLIMAPMVAVRFVLLPSRKAPNLFALGLVALVLLYMGALLQTTQHGLSFDIFKMPLQWTLHAVVFCGVYLWLVDDIGRRLPLLERGLVMMAVACGLLCCLQMLLGPLPSISLMPWGPSWTEWYSRWGFRTYGFFDNPLLAGVILTMIWPLALHRAFAGTRAAKPACFIILLGVVLTGSRSCVLVLFLLTLIQMAPRLKVSGQLIMATGAMAGFVLIILSPMGERFRTLVANGGDENLTHRVVAVEAGFAMINDQPLTGIGPGLFADAYAHHYKPILSQDDPSAYTLDNTLFQMTAETGLPFGAVCLVMFGYLMALVVFFDNSKGRPLAFMMLAYGLLSLMVALYATPVMWLLMVIFAMIEARYNALNANGRHAGDGALEYRDSKGFHRKMATSTSTFFGDSGHKTP